MSAMIILTESQLLDLNQCINEIQSLIQSGQVIKTGSAAQPKAVTQHDQPTTLTSKRRKPKRKRVALTEAKVVEIKRRLAAGNESAQRIANDYGVHVTTVNLIKYGKTWKDVQVPA